MKCEHESFFASVDCGRVFDDSGVLERVSVDLVITCQQCGEPLRFLGLPSGIDLNGASVSVDGTEARLAALPESMALSTLDGAPQGFTIRRFGGEIRQKMLDVINDIDMDSEQVISSIKELLEGE